MTNLAIARIYNLPDTLNALNIFKCSTEGFSEFKFGWARVLVMYFISEKASAVNYPACIWDGHTRRNGTLTVKRNGDFTFIPA